MDVEVATFAEELNLPAVAVALLDGDVEAARHLAAYSRADEKLVVFGMVDPAHCELVAVELLDG
jgi:hypothetical protein